MLSPSATLRSNVMNIFNIYQYLFIFTVKTVVFPPNSALHVILRQSSVMLQSPGNSISLHSSFPARLFEIFSKSSSSALVAESVTKWVVF